MEFVSHFEVLQPKLDKPDPHLSYLDSNSLAEVLRERILRPTITSLGGVDVTDGVRSNLVFKITGGKRFYEMGNTEGTICGQVDMETLQEVVADLASFEFGVDLSREGNIQSDEVGKDHIRRRTIIFPTAVEGLEIQHVHLFDEGEPKPFAAMVYSVATNPITQPESYVKPAEASDNHRHPAVEISEELWPDT